MPTGDSRPMEGVRGRGNGQPRVIAAKLRPPGHRARILSRPRLLNRLEAPLPRLTLISAPAGFGKTVLVTDWLAKKGVSAAWYSLDAHDRDPHRFALHLSRALESLPDPHALPAAEALRAESWEGSTAWSPFLLETLEELSEDLVVVLDDFHELEDGPVPGLVGDMLNRLGGGPRFILVTRVDPPFPVGKLRVTGDLLEIRERDLRFTAEEVADLLGKGLPRTLDPRVAEKLEERTEGWAAGVRLAAVALERAGGDQESLEAFSGRHRFVVDYLVEEALTNLDNSLQTFLMETAILPRFTAEACRFATGAEDAREMIGEAEGRGLFLVSLDSGGQWYRYHNLFAELLRFRLRSLDPQRAEAVCHRASEWFEGEGEVPEALQLAAELSDHRRLVELLDRHGLDMLFQGDFTTFGRWLDEVPDPLRHPYPMFLMGVAWFRLLTEKSPELRPLLLAVEEALEAPARAFPREEKEAFRLFMDVIRAFALRLEGPLPDAIRQSESVLERIPRDQVLPRGILTFNVAASYLRLGEMGPAADWFERSYRENLERGPRYLVLASLGHGAAVLAQTGGVRRAMEKLDSAAALAREKRIESIPAFGVVLCQRSHVHYLADELPESRDAASRALALARAGREPDIEANALVQLARATGALGEIREAEALLSEADAIAHSYAVHLFSTTLAAERARLLLQGSALKAPVEAPVLPDSRLEAEGWTSLLETELLMKLCLDIRKGERETVAALAGRILGHAEDSGRGVAACQARLALIWAEERGEVEWESLNETLVGLGRLGYVRPILEMGDPIRALLQSGTNRSLSSRARAVAEVILDAFDGSMDRLPAGESPELPHPLTDREAEVLAYLADAMSNKAMARKMFVSLDTVKSHLKNLYAKLGVSNRKEAVVRGRELGLI